MISGFQQAIEAIRDSIDNHSMGENYFSEIGTEDSLRYASIHNEEAKKLTMVLCFLENQTSIQPNLQSIYLTPKDLEGLPEELIKELSLSESDKQDFFLMDIMDDLGGIASIDKIMIQAYKKNEEILERQKLSAKLYRMVSKGLIYSLPSKKGVYSLRPISEEEEQSMEN